MSWLFILDKVVIGLGKKIATDAVYQFATLVGMWLVSEVVLPSKKEQKK